MFLVAVIRLAVTSVLIIDSIVTMSNLIINHNRRTIRGSILDMYSESRALPTNRLCYKYQVFNCNNQRYLAGKVAVRLPTYTQTESGYQQLT